MKVRIHFNLQASAKGLPAWVISDPSTGKVIRYVDSVAISNATPRIYAGRTEPGNETGQALTLAGKKRTVHAWFDGELIDGKPRVNGAGVEISYNPRDRKHLPYFHTRDGARVSSAQTIVFAANRKAYAWSVK